ncbi:ras and Rab interactor 2 isoform X1 [Oryzias melastigma]|uniref:Ras and Rab interactor like n=2 Tax=Oryzias melastigma TaxID=30732 RepID=A0A3B3DTC4_ORYME|nr:ras and Rab interactor 2 isoform X1 [Oryzias melastigma]
MAVHSPVNGTTAIPWRGSRKKLSLLEQLRRCQEAWSPEEVWDRERAHAAIFGTPTGSFLVVREAPESRLLCVSAGAETEDLLFYHIRCTDTAFQVFGSQLSFPDLAQLVLFHSMSRDVLDVCLFIPGWIYNLTDRNRDPSSQLDPKMWLSTPPEHQSQKTSSIEPNSVMCSIQLTSTNGALCIINPLYLHEHGDDWLTHKTVQPSTYRRPRRFSSTRVWSGAGLQNQRAISLDQESLGGGTETSALSRARSADSSFVPQGEVILRKSSRDFAYSTGNLSSSPTLGNTTPELQRHSSPLPQSPHRVSWIEDGIWLPPPRPSSLLQPPSLELDSLSVSSIEEEAESPLPSPTPHSTSSHRLADKVMHRLSAVGQVLGGLMCQKKRLIYRVKELSEKKSGVFADAVKAFVDTALKGGTNPSGVMEFLQEVRSSLTSLRETLLDYPDIQAQLDSITDVNDSEIDSFIELSLHKVALKPISAHLYSCILSFRTNDNTLDCLQSNLRVLEKKGIEGLGGSAGVGVPDSVIMERIQQRWMTMHEAYSPNKKIQILLKVCKSIYHSMSANGSTGAVFGADDFLPCLTWVLLRSNLTTLQVDTDYMMELLDPTQLQGEGGYYLTTLYASLFYISSFQPRLAARQLSVEAQKSINQWHRRRTLHCDQSRRSKNRQTIRRQVGKNVDTETEKKEERGRERDEGKSDKAQQPVESSTEVMQTLWEKTEKKPEVSDSETDAASRPHHAAQQDVEEPGDAGREEDLCPAEHKKNEQPT